LRGAEIAYSPGGHSPTMPTFLPGPAPLRTSGEYIVTEGTDELQVSTSGQQLEYVCCRRTAGAEHGRSVLRLESLRDGENVALVNADGSRVAWQS